MKLTRYSLIKLLPFALLSVLACEPKTDSVITPDEPNKQLPAPTTGTPTAVGQSIGAPITKTIGPAGGTLVTPDGKFSLTFPAGAVSKETAITVQPVENTAPNGVGIGFHISPDNLTFDQPVTFSYIYQDKEVAGSSVDAMALALQDQNKVWQLAQPVTVDKPRKTIKARVKKAKWWALVTEYRLLPEEDTVLVAETREIQLKRLKSGTWPYWTGKTAPEASLEDLLVPLTDPENVANGDVVGAYINGENWSGLPPKDQTWGAISWSQTDSRLFYVAPGKKPVRDNPVKVGVEILNPGSGQLMVFSTIYVKGENSLSLDGRSFDDLVVNAANLGGQLMLTVQGGSSGGKNALLTVLLKGAKVGSFPFTTDDKTVVGVLNEAAQDMEAQGASVYTHCRQTVAESGAVVIKQFEQTKGYLKLSCTISGKLVTIHEEDEKCNVIKHKTTTVHAELVTVVKQ